MGSRESIAGRTEDKIIASLHKFRLARDYLNDCDDLGIEPGRCVATEESFVGLLAAKAAQMKVVVIPKHSMAGDGRIVIADH